MQRRVQRRYTAERRFRLLGLAAIIGSAGFLAFLLFTMVMNGVQGFVQTRIDVPVDFARAGLTLDPARLHGEGADLALAGAGLEDAMARAAVAAFGAGGEKLISRSAWLMLRDRLKADPRLLEGRTVIAVPAASDIDIAAKGKGTPEAEAIVAKLKARGLLHTSFNVSFLTSADSSDPTIVGIWGALKGSIFTMLVTLLLAFPVGVLAALYLEEYAPRNWLTDLIEVSINNLAAVPS
ncbi:MAG: DUF3333 domain-containing protein, partial [Sphingomonas sp.]|nr:DUF3333 domain-containing protein [Sphingomonas sp.]